MALWALPRCWAHLAGVSGRENLYSGSIIITKIYPALSTVIGGQDGVDCSSPLQQSLLTPGSSLSSTLFRVTSPFYLSRAITKEMSLQPTSSCPLLWRLLWRWDEGGKSRKWQPRNMIVPNKIGEAKTAKIQVTGSLEYSTESAQGSGKSR